MEVIRKILLALLFIMGLIHLLGADKIEYLKHAFFVTEKAIFSCISFYLFLFYFNKRKVLLSSLFFSVLSYWIFLLFFRFLSVFYEHVYKMYYKFNFITFSVLCIFFLCILILKNRFKAPKGDKYNPDKLQLVMKKPSNWLQMIGAMIGFTPFGTYFLSFGGFKYGFGIKRNKPYSSEFEHNKDFVYLNIENKSIDQAVKDLKDKEYNIYTCNCKIFKKWALSSF